MEFRGCVRHSPHLRSGCGSECVEFSCYRSVLRGPQHNRMSPHSSSPGRTSPVTYQVVGHFKTCFILILGFLVFDAPVVPKNIFGIALAMVGMAVYSEVRSSCTRCTCAYPRSGSGKDSDSSRGKNICARRGSQTSLDPCAGDAASRSVTRSDCRPGSCC